MYNINLTSSGTITSYTGVFLEYEKITGLNCFTNFGDKFILNLNNNNTNDFIGKGRVNIENLSLNVSKIDLTSLESETICNIQINEINKIQNIQDVGFGILNFLIIITLYLLPYILAFYLAKINFLKAKKQTNE